MLPCKRKREGDVPECLASRKSGTQFHPHKYASQAEAMAVAFELVERMKSGPANEDEDDRVTELP
jgi:hypothetical protein